MQHHQFQCSGLDEYAEMQEQIYGILYRSFFYNDHTFLEAIEAAVANATEYSIGEHSSPILITLRIMTHDIAVTVTAATKEFDVCAFRQTLKRLSDDPAIREMDWSAYAKQKNSGAGIWRMLTGCAYLYMDAHGQSVTMVARRSMQPDDIIETRIGTLVPRFFVKKDGVIL